MGAEERVILRVERVSKNFGGLQVLSDINLEVLRGEIVGLIGPNGAGKTTLFNVITGLSRPEKGKIWFLGQDITGIPPHRVCRIGIARTFQIPRPFLSMTVLENVLLAASYGGKGKGSPHRLALEALGKVGLAQKRDRRVFQLNVSERRLLELAIAISTAPLLLLLDEPTAGLNPVETEMLLESIIRIAREGNISVLWIEHKIDAIFDFCERVIVLSYGRKLAEGKPEEIATDKRVIEAYLGEAIA